ncbi:hypothetical protein [Photobacterium damselae]|uniref:hypothetical protein n=1 Tax=Photobacterium damselae TaxID=38293 RepID=UPI00370C0CF3
MNISKLLCMTAFGATILISSGCSVISPMAEREAPTAVRPLDKDGSFAMKVLHAGWGGFPPFEIEDTDVPDDVLEGVNTDYEAFAARGFLTNGVAGIGFGLVNGLVDSAADKHIEEYTQVFAWLPAKGRNINNPQDRVQLLKEYYNQYALPAYQAYFAKHPTMGKVAHKTDMSFVIDSDSLCPGSRTSCEILNSKYSVEYISYADTTKGLPFKGNLNDKYIVIRLNVPSTFIPVAEYNTKSNMFTYIPPISRDSNYKGIQYKGIPYILDSKQIRHFFIK